METEYSRSGKQQQKTKTLYFDFEDEWRIKTSTSNEINIDDPKFAAHIENELTIPQAKYAAGNQLAKDLL